MTDPRVLSAAHNPSVLARNSVDIMNFRSKTKVLCRFSGGATMVLRRLRFSSGRQKWDPIAPTSISKVVRAEAEKDHHAATQEERGRWAVFRYRVKFAATFRGQML